MRLVAAQAYARSPLGLGKSVLPDLIRGLDDPIAVNRVFGTFAVERIRGRPIRPDEFDATAALAVRSRQIEALLEKR
jgi:hypothetical protein